MKKMFALVLSVIIFLIVLFGAQNLLIPKYMDKSREGVLTQEYYSDAHRNDILIIGDCEVYENISPVTLWEEYGFPSFIRGNAQQLIWHAWAMLEDALRYETQTPKVVVLSVLAMMYGEPQKETYNRMALDGLRWSRTKFEAIKASVLPEESVASYFLPLLRFHERWNELGRTDWQHFFTRRQVSIAGFVMRSDVKPAGWLPDPDLLPDYAFGPKAWEYLDRITALCEEKGVQLVLFKAPSLTPHWYEEWEEQIAQYAQEHGLAYLNALGKLDEIGLDYTLDTYDAGLHLNRQGAEKMARYLGGYLQEHCPALEDRRGSSELMQEWAVKSAQYYAMQAAQEKEIAATGEVATFFVPEIDPNHPAPTKPPAPTPMYFMPMGVRLELGMDPARALEALGKPLDFYESPSYGHQKIDNITYRYEGFTFTAIYPEQGDPYIVFVKLTDDTYSTPCGITLGSSTLEDIAAAYGTDYREEHGIFTYTQGPSTLSFAIVDGQVAQIIMHYDVFA